MTIPIKSIHLDYQKWVNQNGNMTLRYLSSYADQYQLYQTLSLPQNLLLPTHSRVNDYMFPRADIQQLYATGQLMIYFFIFDSICDEARDGETEVSDMYHSLHNYLIEALQGREQKTRTLLEQAFSHILAAFTQIDSEWYAVFVQRLRQYIEVADAVHSQDITSLSLDTYLDARVIDSGGLWSASLIEYAQKCYLSPSQRSDEVVQLATHDGVRLCSMLNDLFSYPKEIERDVIPFNAVHVLTISECNSLEEAYYKLIERFHFYLERFKLTTATLEIDDDVPLRSYIQGLREFVSFAWYWHQESRLYRNPNSPFEHMRLLNDDYQACAMPEIAA